MSSYDIKRLALILAIQAEIEAMKITNLGRDMPSEAASYDASHFFEKSRELEELANKHDYEL